LVNDKNSLDQVVSGQKQGTLLHLEGADGISDPNMLPLFKQLGVLSIGLTWNPKNQHAGGVNSKSGLSKLGKDLVSKIESNNILLDVSHLNEKSFWDVVKVAKKAIVATHSNAYAVHKHKRNLKDEQIKAIAKSGGLIGVTFVPKFLNSSKPATIHNVVEQIKYITNLVGVDHVGLGSDFGSLLSTPKGLKNISEISKLPQLLKKQGFSKRNINKIMGENWLRVLGKVIGNKTEWWEKRYTENKQIWAYKLILGALKEDQSVNLEVEKILKHAMPKQNDNILDVCTGQAQHAIVLAQKGFKNITGSDFSPKMLALAQEAIAASKVDVGLVKADVRNLPFLNNYFDLITCLGNSGLGFFEDDEGNLLMVKSVLSKLKKGGKFVFDHTNKEYFLSHFEKDENNNQSKVENKPKKIVGKDGKIYTVAEEFAFKNDRITKTERIKDNKNRETVEVAINRKFFTREEIIELLKSAGFKSAKTVDSFNFHHKGMETHWMSKRDLYIAIK
jgi:membrane dipeptidase